MAWTLYYWPSSPYVRKVLLAAHELGLMAKIDLRQAEGERGEAELRRDNPLGKIPTIIVDDGLVLYESNTICRFLNTVQATPNLFPEQGWSAINQQALVDGMLDAAISRVGEERRPANLRSQDFDRHLHARIGRCLHALSAQTDVLSSRVDMIALSLGAALGYLDFRFPKEDWRPSNPALATWFAAFSDRPSMRATVLHDPD